MILALAHTEFFWSIVVTQKVAHSLPVVLSLHTAPLRSHAYVVPPKYSPPPHWLDNLYGIANQVRRTN